MVKTRSNKVTKWKNCMSFVWHMIYGSLGGNSMVAFIFEFDSRQSLGQVKKGQIAKFEVLFCKICLFYPVFFFSTSKMSFISLRQLEMTKNAFKKVTLSPLQVFTIHNKKEFWGWKKKHIGNLRWPFGRAFILTSFGILRLRFASKLYILEAFEQLQFFYPKWRNTTSIKRFFLKYFSTDFLKLW